MLTDKMARVQDALGKGFGSKVALTPLPLCLRGRGAIFGAIPPPDPSSLPRFLPWGHAAPAPPSPPITSFAGRLGGQKARKIWGFASRSMSASGARPGTSPSRRWPERGLLQLQHLGHLDRPPDRGQSYSQVLMFLTDDALARFCAALAGHCHRRWHGAERAINQGRRAHRWAAAVAEGCAHLRGV